MVANWEDLLYYACYPSTLAIVVAFVYFGIEIIEWGFHFKARAWRAKR